MSFTIMIIKFQCVMILEEEYHNRIFKNLIKKTDRPKILVLGDSFTFGWLLEDKNTFVYKSKKIMRNMK